MNKIEGYEIAALGEPGRVPDVGDRFSVRCIDHDLIPVGVDGQPDAGLIAWPSDEQISAAIGRDVRFLDGGDHPTDPEAIYETV